jgi:hypothetical protein
MDGSYVTYTVPLGILRKADQGSNSNDEDSEGHHLYLYWSGIDFLQPETLGPRVQLNAKTG